MLVHCIIKVPATPKNAFCLMRSLYETGKNAAIFFLIGALLPAKEEKRFGMSGNLRTQHSNLASWSCGKTSQKPGTVLFLNPWTDRYRSKTVEFFVSFVFLLHIEPTNSRLLTAHWHRHLLVHYLRCFLVLSCSMKLRLPNHTLRSLLRPRNPS